MEVKRICQWCGKPFIAQKTTTNYCSHQCSDTMPIFHRTNETSFTLTPSKDATIAKRY